MLLKFFLYLCIIQTSPIYNWGAKVQKKKHMCKSYRFFSNQPLVFRCQYAVNTPSITGLLRVLNGYLMALWGILYTEWRK